MNMLCNNTEQSASINKLNQLKYNEHVITTTPNKLMQQHETPTADMRLKQLKHTATSQRKQYYNNIGMKKLKQ